MLCRPTLAARALLAFLGHEVHPDPDKQQAEAHTGALLVHDFLWKFSDTHRALTADPKKKKAGLPVGRKGKRGRRA